MDIFEERRRYSHKRLEELSSSLLDLKNLIEDTAPCIYATGSYGRMEASASSDLDLFFLFEGAAADSALPRRIELQLLAATIDKVSALGFEPLTERYLEVHNLKRIERALGSPEDDMENAFTARLLLILEGRPVFDEPGFARMRDTVLGFYYRDFADHRSDFSPMFLTNDILRYWRTLCLNYEQRWAERDSATDEAKAKRALDNLKLRFNRLMTCFSMIVPLATRPLPVEQGDVGELMDMTPIERLQSIADRDPKARAPVTELETQYSAWLEQSQSRDELLESLEYRDVRVKRRAEAQAFGDGVFALVTAVATRDRLRPLLV
jgi:hypothetical protein